MCRWDLNGLILALAGLSLTTLLAGCGSGNTADGGIDTDMAQAGRLPAPADVWSHGDAGAGADELGTQAGNMPDNSGNIQHDTQAGNMPAPANVLSPGYAGAGAEDTWSHDDAGEGESADIDLDAALREIAALETPADVDDAVFAELQAELARLLRESSGEENARGVSSAGEDLGYDFSPRINREQGVLTWPYLLRGDYNQDGIVNQSDIVPLAQHFGKLAGDGESEAYFVPGSIPAVIDRNADGEINLADLVAITVCFGERTTDYTAHAAEDWQDVPVLPHFEGVNESPGEHPFATVSFQQSRRSAGGQRYFELALPEQDSSYFWIQQTGPGGVAFSPVARRGDVFDELGFSVSQYRETATGLRYYPETNNIGMLPILQGDSDNNGMISLGDLTAIGVNLNQDVSITAEYRMFFPADNDLNGLIDLKDIAPIMLKLLAALDGYRLYYALDASQLPAGYWAEEMHQPVLEIDYAELVYPDDFDWRDYWRYKPEQYRELPFTPASGSYLYLRPYLGEELGPVCEFVEVP